jgi:hypothetical protein
LSCLERCILRLGPTGDQHVFAAEHPIGIDGAEPGCRRAVGATFRHLQFPVAVGNAARERGQDRQIDDADHERDRADDRIVDGQEQ